MGQGARWAETAEILDVRTTVLRPHFPVGQLAHFEGDDEPETLHALWEEGGVPVAVLTMMTRPFPETHSSLPGAPDLLAQPNAWQVRGMAVLPQAQGTGIGQRLLNYAIVSASLNPPERKIAWCNARRTAAAFYAKSGWAEVGPDWEIPGIGQHVVMWRPMPVLLASSL